MTTSTAQRLRKPSKIDEQAPPRHDSSTPESLAAAIRSGQWPSDIEFDRFMARDLRSVSSRYWSQLAVAARAASWFDELGIETVVDIGSGAGKFCVASALAGRCTFLGLEHRHRLVTAARELAAAFGVGERVRFEHAEFGEVAAPQADAYYLYNPFGENLFGHDDCLDEEVALSTARFVRDTVAVEGLLRAAPVGTHVLTYNGFGGRVPANYSVVCTDRHLPCVLRMWRKDTSVDLGEGPFADSD